MLTQGESVEAHALRARGWSVSAIARHLGRDRRTVRSYLSGERAPGQRKPGGADRFGVYEWYCRIRFGDDPHLWATTLFDEVADLGYEGAYPSFTRALRRRGLRPECEACAAAGTPEEFAVIGHPAGGETQWDWVELPGPPPRWGQGKNAHLLVGALSYSGAWRGVLAECEEQPYLIASLHAVCGRLGGVTRRWRFDRMPAVCHPESGDVTASFAEAAKDYGVIADVWPGRPGLGGGAVAWSAAAGGVLAGPRGEPDHAGAVVRDSGHVAALEKKVMAARGEAGRPCRGKERRPPPAAALSEAAAIRGQSGGGATVTDFAAWAAAARPLRPRNPV